MLKRADLDRDLVFDGADDEAEEEEPEPTRIRLSEWLAFAPEEQRTEYDHRLRHRKVNQTPWPKNRVLCRDPLAEVPEIQRRGTAAYHAFIRAFVDPSFRKDA